MANFDALPLSHFVTHPGPPPESTSHISDPRFLVGLVQKFPDKSPLYKFYLNCSQRFLSGGLLSGRFCPGWFLSVPLLSQYICCNWMLNITLNFMFHMYDKNVYKRDVTCSWPPPLSQAATPSRTPPPRAWRTLCTAPISMRSGLWGS